MCSSYCPLHLIHNQDKMNNLRIILTSLVLLTCAYKSWCLIKHCDPDTDKNREEMMDKGNYAKLKKYLQEDPKTNGRIGIIMFANWQDQLLHIEAPKQVIGNCLWKMKSEGKSDKEASDFNEKGYIGKHLYAGALQKNYYLRTISCETDNCVQYYNIISRPITKPKFPVQVYVGHELDIPCTLELMEDNSKEIAKPPFKFIWTGPKECKEQNWDKDNSSCKLYQYQGANEDTCLSAKGCEVNIEPSGPYKNTKLKIVGKPINKIKSQSESVLQIKDATMDHDGKWRCIVIDGNGVSSDPGLKEHKALAEHSLIHEGVVELHVKTIWFAIGVPLAIILGVIVVSLLCILLCKQCTDFDITPEETADSTGKDHPGLAVTQTGKSVAVSSTSIPAGPGSSSNTSNTKPGTE